MHATPKNYLTVLMGWGLFLLLLPQAGAKSTPPATNQTTHALTGSTNTVGAVSGLDDKSPMSIVLPGSLAGSNVRAELQTLLKKFNPSIQNLLVLMDSSEVIFKELKDESFFEGFLALLRKTILDKHIRPEGLIYLEAQARVGGGSPFYAPGALISGGRIGADIGAQSYIGQYAGYGLSFRKDLSWERQKYANYAYIENDYVLAAKRLFMFLTTNQGYFLKADNPSTTYNHKDMPTTFKGLYEDFIGKSGSATDEETHQYALHTFIDFSRHTHISAFYGYRLLHDIGQLHSVGLSISQLLTPAAHNSPHSGLSGLLNVQGVFFSPDNILYGSNRAAVRTGIALIWQNEIPYLRPSRTQTREDGSRPDELYGRWRWQVGLEYRFRNVIDGHDLLDGFLRYRDTHTAVETTVSIGKGTDDNLYLGFSIGKSFTF